MWRFRLAFSTGYNLVGLIFLLLAFIFQSPIEISNALNLIGQLCFVKTAMWMMIVAGCLSLIVGFVTSAVCGFTSKLNTKILPLLYVAALVCIVIMQLVSGIYILVQRANARQTLLEEFEKLPAVDYQSTDDEDRLVLTALQVSLECCGFTRGCRDWQTATISIESLGTTNLLHMAPDCTCQADEDKIEEECHFYGNLNDPKATCFDNTNGEKAFPLYSTSCYSKIADHVENRMAIFGSVLLVIAILELCGLIAAFLVFRQATWEYGTTGTQSAEEASAVEQVKEGGASEVEEANED